ncbi:MAG: hypothetical protein VX293_10150, partial [Candidatus Latescibacterota bacterium]|nr:hypothetical protein [Candidatus Latescibacterota bacterium]
PSFLERFNGTDRHRNSRKNRKTYRFSKGYQPRTPAMAAGLTDHVWTLRGMALLARQNLLS